jgi:hypothetical protein
MIWKPIFVDATPVDLRALIQIMNGFPFAWKLSIRMRNLCLRSFSAAPDSRRFLPIFSDFKRAYPDRFTAIAAVNRS